MRTTRFGNRKLALLLVAFVGAAVATACSSSDEETSPTPSGGTPDAGADVEADAPVESGDEADASSATTIDSVPLQTTLNVASLSAPVDVVRDEWGIPHIYGASLPDVAYAQGYVTARDRLPQMDIIRHNADGSLTEIVGGLYASVFDSDVKMRAHHLRSTAQKTWDALQASTAADDVLARRVLTSYAAGVNAVIDEFKQGKYAVPAAFALIYGPESVKPWTEVDSLLMGNFQAFSLAFDAASEIQNTRLKTAAATAFPSDDVDPRKAARAKIAEDLGILAPIDPTYTIDGWTGMGGDTSTAMAPAARDGNFRALLDADALAVRDVGNDHMLHPSRGSNNWIVGPQLSKTGHTLVANDTHLSLTNPAVFHLVHLVSTGKDDAVDAMGVAFPGIPAVILGMNQHVAWGATVNNVDVTDVYAEEIAPCAGSSDPCVMFQGNEVPLVPRVEHFSFAVKGIPSGSVDVTMYDVPHHGPILPRPTAAHDGIDPLGSSELSVRYTGHEPAPLFGAVIGLVRAKTVEEAKTALDGSFKYGGQNWVIGDDQGNFGWTEVIRVPRRTAGHAPWEVLPGDGSAEWTTDLDPKYIPHAWNPAKGFLATANADPIGVTDDGDPFFGEPVVGDAPLYLGWNYDPGTRVGRITKRLQAATANGAKVGIDDMQSIQADDVSEWGEKLAPTLIDAATALAAELAQPGTHPELASVVQAAGADAKAIAPALPAILSAWTHASPSGAAETNPTAADVTDSQAMMVFAAWASQFSHATLDDEIAALGVGASDDFVLKMLVRACTAPAELKTGVSDVSGDAVLFDDLGTEAIEGKREIAAKALVAAIDVLVGAAGDDVTKWRWGQVHTLALEFLAPLDPLRVPLRDDPQYGAGFPRHGGIGTVDVGDHGLSKTDFSYDSGPAIRFVCELDPKGPKARNVLPGGEIFDTESPHYRDQMELWRKNQAIDLAFQTADVVKSAHAEYVKNKLGRVRFAP